MPIVLGLIGAKDTGKDVISGFFVREKGFKKFAFADKIKEGYYLNSGHTEEEFKSSRNLPKEEEIRKGLWEYSDEKISKYGKLYFIAPIIEEIKICNKVIISDIRKEEELEELLKIDAKIIYIYKNVDENKEYIPDTRIKFEMLKKIKYIKFWNYYDKLERLYERLEKFYKENLE